MSNTRQIENKKNRSWCFTSFEVTQEELDKFLLIPSTYMVVGKEVCPETGKYHYQGYVEFSTQRYFKGVKKILGAHVHLEPRLGTALQAATYCKKDGEYHEQGTLSQPQGKRNDLASVKTSVEEGTSLDEIIDLFPGNLQAIKYATTILPYKEPKRNWMPVTRWFHGDTGTGKTWTAVTAHPDLRVHIQNDTAQWWCGYDGHEVVVIDDYRPDFCKFKMLLALLDRYALRIPCKFGSRQFRPKFIYITSPEHPSYYFQDLSENVTQLNRRIAEVRHFPKKYRGPMVDIDYGLPPTTPNNSSEATDEEDDSF